MPLKNSVPSLADRFLDTFDVSLVSSSEQMKQAQRIRYRVYCEEKNYEPAFRFPDRCECDKFDSHASHCLVTHRETGLPAACIRLVGAYDGLAIPFEEHCGQSVFNEFAAIIKDNRELVGEFSRIAVDPTFRGAGVSYFPEHKSAFTASEKATFPLISVAALLSAFAVAELTGREHIFAMMARSLARMMSRCGVAIETAGAEVNYHGRRNLHYSSTSNVLQQLKPELRALYDVIFNDFGSQLAQETNSHKTLRTA